jgi:hypothetical protein
MTVCISVCSTPQLHTRTYVQLRLGFLESRPIGCIHEIHHRIHLWIVVLPYTTRCAHLSARPQSTRSTRIRHTLRVASQIKRLEANVANGKLLHVWRDHLRVSAQHSDQ